MASCLPEPRRPPCLYCPSHTAQYPSWRLDCPSRSGVGCLPSLARGRRWLLACLSPVDHLAYIALHILRNILLGDWIVHHVRELAVFLHSHADDDGFWHT